MQHEIKLEPNLRPFHERYCPIPQSMYEEVSKHLQELLEVGVIRPSSSPWVSAAVLVKNRDGKLQFCINLYRLNNINVKDAYSLPWIQETLECFQGAVWFTSLDLKSGYWQGRIKEECKAYTAFTLELLRFYECKSMPFRLTNAPAPINA